MDIKLIVKALEEYEKFKGLIPAIKAEYEQIVKAIDKLKEIYKIEKQAYDDVVSKKVSLTEELGKQKDLFLKEIAEGKLAVLKMKQDAEEIFRQAGLLKAELDAAKSVFESEKAKHKSLVDKFKADLAKVKEVIQHIF